MLRIVTTDINIAKRNYLTFDSSNGVRGIVKNFDTAVCIYRYLSIIVHAEKLLDIIAFGEHKVQNLKCQYSFCTIIAYSDKVCTHTYGIVIFYSVSAVCTWLYTKTKELSLFNCANVSIILNCHILVPRIVSYLQLRTVTAKMQNIEATKEGVQTLANLTSS